MNGVVLITVVLLTTTICFVAGQDCLTSKSCSGHGGCIRYRNTCQRASCRCDDAYTGKDCSTPYDCTTDGDCGAHGSCFSHRCDCRDGYSGRFCSIPPPEPRVICTVNGTECGDHGECDTECGQAACLCYDGYTGPYCTEGVVKRSGTCVSDRACNGHGKCIKPGTCFSSCDCEDGYSGTYCEKAPVCTNNGNQCGYHGTCFRNTQCVCRDKYTGVHCEIPPCTAGGKECGDHGECNTCMEDAPFCQCYDGWGGNRCEMAPVCTRGGNECKNGGTCMTSTQPFRCSCPCGLQHSPTCEHPKLSCDGQRSTSGASHITCIFTTKLLALFVHMMAH